VPSLKIREGGKETIHQIEEDLITIGRGPTNTIEISDGKASKEHCRIERFDNRWKLIDLESKNGTRVNGDFCNRAWLEHGDTIAIGRTEIDFRMEGASRGRSAAPARAAAKPARGARADARRDETEREEEEPRRESRRYPRHSTADRTLMIGLFAVGAIVVIIIVGKVASSMARDDYNLALLVRAEELKARDQWQEALDYLQANADPDGNAYPEVQKRIRQIQSRKDDFYRARAEQAANTLLSKLSRKIKSYHAGKTRGDPAEIFKMVERMKTEFAATTATANARKEFPAWFAGKRPERGINLLRSGSELRKDWDEVVRTSYDYEKEWRFREARETIERFLTQREAVLDADEVEHYRKLTDEKLHRLNLSMDGIYRAQERRSFDLIKKKRYDQAIALFQKVVDKFGIDLYMRKAQAEIQKLKAMKPG